MHNRMCRVLQKMHLVLQFSVLVLQRKRMMHVPTSTASVADGNGSEYTECTGSDADSSNCMATAMGRLFSWLTARLEMLTAGFDQAPG